MSQINVALLQMQRPEADLDLTASVGLNACRRARALGADIAVLPEMWSTGYHSTLPEYSSTSDLYRAPELWNPAETSTIPMADDVWGRLPVAADSDYVRRFQDLARESSMAIALSILEDYEPSPRNTTLLIDRHGDVVLRYAKVHSCVFDIHEVTLTAGDAFPVVELDTAAGPVNVGAMICYDREFPEAARCLMLGGAELVIVPNACDLDINRIAQIRTRSYENMMAIAVANYAGPGWGHSVAFDGIGFSTVGSRDMLVAEAGENAGIVLASFDLTALRAYRTRESWGDAFRRPSTYQAIVDAEYRPPFLRQDIQGRTAPR